MVDPEEGIEISPEELIKWERIQCPKLRLDPPNGWSMATIRDHSLFDHQNQSIVFPPINHEGLSIFTSTSTSPHSNHPKDDDESSPLFSSDDFNPETPPSSSPPPPPPPPPIPRPRLAGDTARWWLNLGLGLLRSKVTGIASALRNFATSRGTIWPFHTRAGAVALALAMIAAILYLRLRQRRRLRIQEESKDHLILLLKETDEKINQLLRQIAQMNEVLLALHRVPLSKTV